MSKRPADAAAAVSGKSSKRKYFQSKSGTAYVEFGPGIRGVLITCDCHAEKEAIRETYQLLEALAEVQEEAGDAVRNDTSSDTVSTAGEGLAAELAALRGSTTTTKQGRDDKGGARLFSVAQTGCSGTVFIRFEDRSLDPVHLVDRAMEQACKTGNSGAPHVVRMLPVQTSCSARSVSSLVEAATPHIHAALHGYTGTYAIHWRRRFNGDIDKMSVINGMASTVQTEAPKATVNLGSAEAVVCVEVIKTTGCVSVLPRWREFEQYNLRALSERYQTLGVPKQTVGKKDQE